MLVKELQALALDVKVFNEGHEEIELGEDLEDERDLLDVIKDEGKEEEVALKFNDENAEVSEDDFRFDTEDEDDDLNLGDLFESEKEDETTMEGDLSFGDQLDDLDDLFQSDDEDDDKSF